MCGKQSTSAGHLKELPACQILLFKQVQPESGQEVVKKKSPKPLNVIMGPTATVDMKVPACTNRRRLDKFNFHGRGARRRLSLSNKTVKVRLQFVALVDKDQIFGIMSFEQ